MPNPGLEPGRPKAMRSKLIVSAIPPVRHFIRWSGRQDLNLRLPGSKPGTLTKLSYAQTETVRVAGVGLK